MVDDFDLGVAMGATIALVGVLLAGIVPSNTRTWIVLWVILMALSLYIMIRTVMSRRSTRR